jgi:hypothetical protein
VELILKNPGGPASELMGDQPKLCELQVYHTRKLPGNRAHRSGMWSRDHLNQQKNGANPCKLALIDLIDTWANLEWKTHGEGSMQEMEMSLFTLPFSFAIPFSQACQEVEAKVTRLEGL